MLQITENEREDNKKFVNSKQTNKNFLSISVTLKKVTNGLKIDFDINDLKISYADTKPDHMIQSKK